jgi:SAM-dependent methyltransferase
VEDCGRRLGGRAGLEFASFKDVAVPPHDGRYDAVVCMEVLEHVVDVDALLAQIERWLAPGGELLVSVPVETGLPLLVKQSARRVAGWFGVGDYPGTSPYTWSEMARSVFAGERPHIQRPLHHAPDGFPFHDHKGFNWMALRVKLAGRFELLRVAASPFLWLTPHLGSQAWFLCRKRG